MDVEFDGEVWYWRGPAPFHFVSVPEPHLSELTDIAGQVSYGWGCIRATCRTGRTDWTTSLIPRNGGYAVPVKTAVRRAEEIELGDVITIRLRI